MIVIAALVMLMRMVMPAAPVMVMVVVMVGRAQQLPQRPGMQCTGPHQGTPD